MTGDGTPSRTLAQVPGDLPLNPVQLILGLSGHDGAHERGTLLVSGERAGGIDPECHASNLGNCTDDLPVITVRQGTDPADSAEIIAEQWDESQLRRSVCAAGQPARPQVSQPIGLSGSDREFPVLTGRSGTQRARRIRSGP